jgi:MFS family permease
MNDVEPPRVSRRRALMGAVAGLTVAGVFVGALWAWLAPPIHGVVALTKSGERVKAYLGNESDHFFVAAFLFGGMLSALAVIAAVLLWQWRVHRGPQMVAALAIGAATAAGAAAGVGAALVHWRYGSIDMAAAPVSPEHRVHYVIEAPAVFFGHSPLMIAATVLLPVAAAALVYALLAVSTQRDDLGAWPPVDEPVIGPPVTADGVLPSAQ